MALSYCYSNWDPCDQHLTSDEINNELLDFNNDLLLTHTSIDPLFQSSYPSFHPDSYNNYSYNYYSDYYQQVLFCGHIQNPSMLQDFSSVTVPPLPDFATAPPVYSSGSFENTLPKKPSGGSLSVQSIAARQRRRRITEKTQELGKLVPGGQKMNTAEMLQAVYKYVKFLQAQVRILEFMGSYEKNGQRFLGEELHELLESPLMQEKLYSKEKCLVPQEFVQTLANDGEIEPNFEEPKQAADVK